MTEIVTAYNTDAKRITYEDFGDDPGFRLRWAVANHWADVTVYEYVGQEVDCVEDINDAEVYLDGFVKWDGCSELDMGCPHWCGPHGWQKHIALLEHIWRTAFELMGKPLPSQWANPLDHQ